MIDRLSVWVGSPELRTGPSGRDGSVLAGELFLTVKGGRLVSSTFTYDTRYLAHDAAFAVDPALGLHTGAQYVQGLPGAIQDCSPDRWGRNLITRAHRHAAGAEGRRPPALTDVDFLAGVSDVTRQGALRFSVGEDGPFLGEGADVPATVELPRLLRAAEAASDESESFTALKALLDAGTGSLGGARPKASVRDGDQLLIAKFPHPGDAWDVMAWEKTALDLAALAGITVPARRLTRVDGRAVLLLHRFDRGRAGRIPYISAMTLLGASDGDVHDYLEIAETVPEVSAATRSDLNELWRRIAFSALVNNVDDHLRNHGFLHERGGWRLSPVFDVNPDPDPGRARQTGVFGAFDRQDVLAALRGAARDFDLSAAAAQETMAQVVRAVSRWRTVAARNGVAAQEITRFAEAFTLPAGEG